MASKKKGKRRRVDMGALPPDPQPIPDTFEQVIHALVQPVVPKQEGSDKQEQE